MLICLLVHLLLVFMFSSCGTCSMDLISGTLPGCQDKCGNVNIPYPFGLSDSCQLPGFHITCNHTYNTPKPFISTSTGNIEIFNIMDETLTVDLLVAAGDDCESSNTSDGVLTLLDGDQLPYSLSQTRNMFTVIGCNTIAYLYDYNGTSISGCASDCNNLLNTNNVDGTCSGHNGCCQIHITNSFKSCDVMVSKNNETLNQTIINCSKAFLVAKDHFKYNASYIKSFNQTKVPVVLDWAIGNRTCDVAESSNDYACRDNTRCVNSTDGLGYRCSCLEGNQGNPYLPGGCQGIIINICSPISFYVIL